MYTLPPEGFEKEKARLLCSFYAAFLMALAAAAILAVRYLDFNTSGAHMLWSILAVTACVSFSMSTGFWAIFRSLRQRRQAWNSYRLHLHEDRIVRTTEGYPTVELHRHQVRQIRETTGRGLMIHSHELGHYIFVPASLTGYEELKNQLAGWGRPAPPRRRDPLWRSPFFVGAACLAGWSVLYLSDNNNYILLAASVLLSFLIATYITVLRSPNVSLGSRRAAWIYLLVAGMVLLKVYQALHSPE